MHTVHVTCLFFILTTPSLAMPSCSTDFTSSVSLLMIGKLGLLDDSWGWLVNPLNLSTTRLAVNCRFSQ